MNSESRKHHVGPWMEDQLRNDILNKKVLVGNKLFSATQLAEYYKVDKMTAHKVVQLLVQEGLLRTERGNGTFLNIPKEIGTAGILHFENITSDSPYQSISRDLQLCLKKHGFRFESMARSKKENLYGPDFGDINSKNFDIMITLGIANKDFFRKLLWLKTPILAIDYQPGLENIASVSADSFNCGYDAANRLIELGHKSLLFMPEERGSVKSNLTREYDSYQRECGWRLRILENHGEVESYCLQGSTKRPQVKKEFNKILSSLNPPTAIFGSGQPNYEFLKVELKKLKLKVPNDINLLWVTWEKIKYENLILSQYTLNWKTLSKYSTQTLTDLISGNSPQGKNILVNTSYIEGKTTQKKVYKK